MVVIYSYSYTCRKEVSDTNSIKDMNIHSVLRQLSNAERIPGIDFDLILGRSLSIDSRCRDDSDND